MDGGPKVAFDYAIKAIAGRSVGQPRQLLSPSGTRASTTATFAVLACPAWMLGHIKDTAPGTKGKWDIAAIPGGGGNWGGSFLTIPKQGKHVDEAYELAGVADPAGAADRDLQEGRQPALAAGALPGPGDRRLQEPVLQQRAGRADLLRRRRESLTPQYLGKKNGPTRVAVENVLNRRAEQDLKPDAAWAEAVKEAEKAARS